MLKECSLFKKARYRVAQRGCSFKEKSIFSVFETLFIDSFRVKMQKFLHFLRFFAVFEARLASISRSKAGALAKLGHQDPRSKFIRFFVDFLFKKSAAKAVSF